MNAFLFYSVGVVILGLLAIFLYKFGRTNAGNSGKGKIVKYIPAIFFTGSIGLVLVKMTFISQRYETIVDMILLIILASLLAISLLIAVMMDLLNREH